MKHLLNIVLSVLLVTAVSSLVFAEEPKGSMMGKEMMKGGMMGKKGMMEHGKMMGMCSMHGMMMKAMMGKSLVATKDGGIVVISGNKLMKYDKNLNLKKEVELKMDMMGMQKMMMQTKGECPMRNKMMGEGEMMGGALEGSQDPAEPAEASEHEAQH